MSQACSWSPQTLEPSITDPGIPVPDPGALHTTLLPPAFQRLVCFYHDAKKMIDCLHIADDVSLHPGVCVFAGACTVLVDRCGAERARSSETDLDLHHLSAFPRFVTVLEIEM